MIATLQTVSATEGIYAINNTGSSFVNNSRNIAPFECYVICKQGSTDAPDSFDLPAKLPTAIDNETVTGSKIYTADGNLVIIHRNSSVQHNRTNGSHTKSRSRKNHC